MRVVALSAIDLRPAQSEMQRAEPGFFAVVAGEAQVGNALGQQGFDGTVVRFVTGQAFAIGCRRVGDVADDELADVLVTARADPDGLIGKKCAESAPVGQVTGTAFTVDDRRMRTHCTGRNIGVMTTTAKRHLTFRQQIELTRCVRQVTGSTFAIGCRHVPDHSLQGTIHHRVMTPGAQLVGRLEKQGLQ